jgi:hypothetical protein
MFALSNHTQQIPKKVVVMETKTRTAITIETTLQLPLKKHGAILTSLNTSSNGLLLPTTGMRPNQKTMYA